MLLAISERAEVIALLSKKSLRTDFEEYREVNELILQGRKLGSDVLIAEAKDSKCYDTVVISKAADAMLAMSGIEASFVLAKNTQGIYLYLSSQS